MSVLTGAPACELVTRVSSGVAQACAPTDVPVLRGQALRKQIHTGPTDPLAAVPPAHTSWGQDCVFESLTDELTSLFFTRPRT